MRPPRMLPRRRAALVSVVGHGAAFALVAFVNVRSVPPAGESPLILAELVTALGPTARSSPPPAEVEASPPPALIPPPPLAPSLDAPPPAPAVADVELEPEPEPDLEPAPTVDPSLERVVESLDPPPEPAVEPLDPPPAVAAEQRPTEAAVAENPPSRALASREQETVLRKLSSWTGRFSADAPEETMRWRDDGQAYTAVLRKMPAADATGMEQLAVELTTERDGERLVTELRMNRLAFSNFGQFVNEWDRDVSLHDDVIDGRFHSNSELVIGRTGRTTPEFRGKVTIAGGSYTTGSGPGFISKQKLFPAGLETRTRRIELPNRAAALEAVAGPDNSQRFERDSAVTFHADGTVSWRHVEAADREASRALGDEPFYLVGFEGVDLEIRGTVNGKVLIYTPGRIVIADDVRYAVDPRMEPSDDYLGLVAERTVEIAEPDITGTGDLEVFASIYARQRFVVRDFHAQRSGTLMIHGSLTAGTLTASEPRYATRIEFDQRLTTMRAPSFPLSDRYELDSASGEWRVVGAVD